MEQTWKKLINCESKSGEWDWFHHPENKLIRLIRFNEENEITCAMDMLYEEFEDLSKLILKLNGE